jgi:hypothetical protein
MSAHTVGTGLTLGKNGGDGEKIVRVPVTGSASYDTGGSTADFSSIFGDEVNLVSGKALGTTGYEVQMDSAGAAATRKLVVFTSNGTQVSGSTDLSGVTFQLIVVGTDV